MSTRASKTTTMDRIKVGDSIRWPGLKSFRRVERIEWLHSGHCYVSLAGCYPAKFGAPQTEVVLATLLNPTGAKR